MRRTPATLRFPARSLALFATLLLAAFAPAARAQATNYETAPPVLLGAAWYPEQWPESTWEADLTRMEAAHIHLARITEFAWSSMEPSEGDYRFDWVDHAIAAAAKHHIVIVLGTPSAAPPAWLTTKYPQTLRIDENGKRDEHGNRQQFSFADAKYRELSRDITERMAVRYGHNPNVVGWQIDNELAAPSFDPEARQQWHAWLKKKYGSTEEMNKRWTTAYWSQTYDSFDEVPAREDGENPALLLDWKRFVTDTWISYTDNQTSVIRVHADKRQFITTNTMGWFDGFDSYKEHKNLDLAAWDDYISTDVLDWADNAARHDLTRGYKQRNFWVMETEPAFVNWRPVNTPLDKGQTRELAWQAIGHGADAVEYWQWRSDLNGQEEYHGVLVGADGEPVPVYAEVQQTGAEFELAGKALAGTEPHSQVALINDFDSRWAINFQKHNHNFNPVAEMVSFYRPLRELSQGVDVISADAPLDKYKVVVAPGLNVLPQATADRLIAYVRGGGHLMLGPRSGMKNEDNGLNVQRQPGSLLDLLGARVDQFYALDKPVPVTADGVAGTADIWAETLSLKSPETGTFATYGASNGWLDGQPAAVVRKVGKGEIAYVGAVLDEASMARITAGLLRHAEVKPLLPGVPDGVEVCVRTARDGGHSVVILINHNKQAATVQVPAGMENLLVKGAASNSVELPGYGVAVFSTNKAM